MKILISQKRFHPNSIGIVRGFINKNHQVKVFVQSTGSLDEDYNTIKPTLVPYNRFFKFIIIKLTKSNKTLAKYCPPRLFNLVKELSTYKPDVIILKKYRSVNIFVYLFAKLLRIKKIIILSDSPFLYPKKSISKFVLKLRLVPKFNIYTAEPSYNSLLEINYQGIERIFLPYPIDENFLKQPKYQLEKDVLKEDDVCKIICVGKFTSDRKRHDWVLNGLIENKLLSSIHLTYIGTGDDTLPIVKKLKKIAQRHDYEKNMDIIFNVPHENMSRYYKNHDLFVLPAKNEPFGAVVIEALASGLPIICSDTCGSRTAVKDDYNGYIFKTNDFQNFKEKLNLICLDSEKLKLFGKRSFQLALDNYSVDNWIDSLFSLVEN